MKRFSWIVGFVLLCVAGCKAPRPAKLTGSTKDIRADDYEDVLATWTRSTRIYQQLDDKLFVTVTFHTPEFRRAFAVAFPEIYGHGGSITKQELVDLTGDVEHYNNFFVAMYTPNVKWNDLAKPDSIWRLTLIGEKGRAGPAKIVPIKVDENLRAVYPHINRFDLCYLVRFPLADLQENMLITPRSPGFRLRIASALGVAELLWKLTPP